MGTKRRDEFDTGPALGEVSVSDHELARRRPGKPSASNTPLFVGFAVAAIVAVGGLIFFMTRPSAPVAESIAAPAPPPPAAAVAKAPEPPVPPPPPAVPPPPPAAVAEPPAPVPPPAAPPPPPPAPKKKKRVAKKPRTDKRTENALDSAMDRLLEKDEAPE